MNGMCDETCKGCVYVRVMAGEIGFGNRRTRQTAWCDYIGADALSAKVTIGYIVGVKDFAGKMIEGEQKNDN